MADFAATTALRSALFTDLYELTMAQAYDAEGINQPAVFELFFRTLPPDNNFLMAAGFNEVLTYLEQFRFQEDDLAWLAEQGQFSAEFLDRLAKFRFHGDVFAVSEGTIVFANEPLIQIVAPILEAQLVETLVLNQLHFQSLAATKAARIILAARGRTVVDFGSRRAHGAEAALHVARTSYLAGAAGTSNVLAGKAYGIPTFGTMAHSYIQAHHDEAEAFANFARLYPGTTLLVDTYDTLRGVKTVIDLSRRHGEAFRAGAIRLDSGDLAELAVEARRLLDDAGLASVRIFASSELDEFKIAEFVARDIPIDGFGVGTKLAVADGASSLDMAYKLVEYAGQPRTKLSSEKISYPGRKQIFRQVDEGKIQEDVIGRHDEDLDGEALLQPVMRGGQRLAAGMVRLEESRTYARNQVARLPEPLQALRAAEFPYPVQVSKMLQGDFETIRHAVGRSS